MHDKALQLFISLLVLLSSTLLMQDAWALSRDNEAEFLHEIDHMRANPDNKVPDDLDQCGGHAFADIGYHYLPSEAATFGSVCYSHRDWSKSARCSVILLALC